MAIKKKQPKPTTQINLKLQDNRILMGMSKHQMSEVIGVSPTAYGQLERGGIQVRFTSLLAYFHAVAQHLDIPIESLQIGQVFTLASDDN